VCVLTYMCACVFVCEEENIFSLFLSHLSNVRSLNIYYSKQLTNRRSMRLALPPSLPPLRPIYLFPLLKQPRRVAAAATGQYAVLLLVLPVVVPRSRVVMAQKARSAGAAGAAGAGADAEGEDCRLVVEG